ncbi:ricin-type beta-trefoil lectin protein [Chitinophaga polysaccharea]|uniref:Ricin-type beta-trefoil lectin protein n=1 Tax=Chitinophaga polysaccharea TaxID=1293035 RepID=A0A561PMA2_9BACT|nr:RICIN domain-containing protein [Chitinophaga polysaccharea]TWF39208.1 ricin-type beta-trefoil lectin protein [Chitinophaga polysaccharea]
MKINKLLFGFTFLFVLATLETKAFFSLKDYSVAPNNKGALRINPGNQTQFDAYFQISFIGSENISCEIIYVAHDQSETLVLAGPKSINTSAGGANSGTIDVQMNSILPANKTKGSIYIRLKTTSSTVLSQPIEIYDSSIPVNPPGGIEQKIRSSIAPKGSLKEEVYQERIGREPSTLPPTGIYLTYTITSDNGDGYFDLSSNPNPVGNTKVIRKEFYAYTSLVMGTVPVYKFTEKNNPQKIIYTTIRAQDESIWEFKEIAFYAYDAESYRRTGLLNEHIRFPKPVYLIQHETNFPWVSDPRTFYGVIPAAIGGEWRQPSYIQAAFLAWPAYSVASNGDFLDGVYELRVRSTNKVLGSMANDAIVQQSTSDRGSTQGWLFTRQGDGKTFKISAVNSGLALTVAGGVGAIKSGANIVQSPWVDREYQKWTIEPGGDGFLNIKIMNDNLILSIEGNAGWDGAPVILWTPQRQTNEEWTLKRL